MTPFEIRRQVEAIALLKGPALDHALAVLYKAVLIECANPSCPDPKTLAREALRADGIFIKIPEL